MLKRDRAYANVESEESMCLKMKCNTITRDGLRYTNYAEVGTCGATILLAIALASQLFLNGCADACAASILAILKDVGS